MLFLLRGDRGTKVIPALNTSQHFGQLCFSLRCNAQTLFPFNCPSFPPSTTSVHFLSILWHLVCNARFENIPFKIWYYTLQFLLRKEQRNKGGITHCIYGRKHCSVCCFSSQVPEHPGISGLGSDCATWTTFIKLGFSEHLGWFVFRNMFTWLSAWLMESKCANIADAAKGSSSSHWPKWSQALSSYYIPCPGSTSLVQEFRGSCRKLVCLGCLIPSANSILSSV